MLEDAGENRYIPYFLVHNLLVFYLLTYILLVKGKDVLYYCVIALVTVHAGYLIIKRPYQSIISNLAVIYNQTVILFCFFWVMSKGTSIDTP
jgi:hypothetical protein